MQAGHRLVKSIDWLDHSRSTDHDDCSSASGRSHRPKSSLAVGGFAVLDNHLHLLVRLDPEVAQGWSDEDVVRRWGRLFPPRDRSRRPLEVSDDWVRGHLTDAAWVAQARRRLQSLSWFMKCLKEPLAR